ncbi:MAG: Rrf2 family transcriptional regulator [Spirochaetales bacterium]|nr:Rrf2 family transcriptional regulator [Spirochaetota bacterium]NLV61093.1 Rrf2 family transcriptional regulator [Spirochaetales bacterium]
MKLSTKGRYSLQTLVYLATCKENCSIRKISEATGISSGYLEQLMIPLRRAGLVEADRGVFGGYRLGRTGITCQDVLIASEGVFRPAPCKECQKNGLCKTHQIWSLLQTAVSDFSKEVLIEDLAAHLVDRGTGGGI